MLPCVVPFKGMHALLAKCTDLSQNGPKSNEMTWVSFTLHASASEPETEVGTGTDLVLTTLYELSGFHRDSR